MSEAVDVAMKYDDVERRIEGLDRSQVRVGVLGSAFGYEIKALKVGRRAAGRKEILMTGGIHGDEPAGIEAVLSFLEGPVESYLDDFFFTVIPCVNPSGLDLGTRKNKNGQDVNRAMSDDKVVESVMLRKFVAGKRFDVFFDHHEDYEATGYYMYEAQRDDQLIGQKIVESIKAIGPLDGDENTDEGLDLPISEGLYGINPKWRKQGWSAFAYYENSNHVVLCETPSTAWDLDRRVEAHRVAQLMTLDHYKNRT